MPSSLKLVLALLAVLALGTPVSLYVQRRQTESEAHTMAAVASGASPERGKALIQRAGCGACHTILGVPGAAGQVGPSLTGLNKRTEIAARLQNDPGHMAAWIRHPQAIQPGSGMPEMGLSDQDARDITAFLYTVRLP